MTGANVEFHAKEKEDQVGEYADDASLNVDDAWRIMNNEWWMTDDDESWMMRALWMMNDAWCMMHDA